MPPPSAQPATALLFPGQGAQRVGMGVDLFEQFASARAVFALAEEASGLPIARLCAEGPAEALRRTDVAQPALLTVELAALAALGEQLGMSDAPLPDIAERLGTRWTAGHSLGEYAACVASGALAPSDGLRLAAARGRAMAAAPPGAMAAVLGIDAEQLRAICADTPGTVVVANDNAPGQIVISGEPDAVAAAGAAARAAGASRVVPLEVGGAFHSPLMEEPARAFAALVDAAPIAHPRFVVVANSSALPLTTADEVRDELRAQIATPVRWRESVLWLADVGAVRAVECGPGSVLAGLARRTAPGLTVHPLGSAADVTALADRLAMA